MNLFKQDTPLFQGLDLCQARHIRELIDTDLAKYGTLPHKSYMYMIYSMSTVTLTILHNDLQSKFTVSDYPCYLYRLNHELVGARCYDYFRQESGIIAHLFLQFLFFEKKGRYLCLALWHEISMSYRDFINILILGGVSIEISEHGEISSKTHKNGVCLPWEM